MAKRIEHEGVQWDGEPTGWSHEVDNHPSTSIEFRRVDGTGEPVIGRIRIRPEEIGQATDAQYQQALEEALSPDEE
jgi:hypothetical protein